MDVSQDMLLTHLIQGGTNFLSLTKTLCSMSWKTKLGIIPGWEGSDIYCIAGTGSAPVICHRSSDHLLKVFLWALGTLHSLNS